jgi:hypothetical protein
MALFRNGSSSTSTGLRSHPSQGQGWGKADAGTERLARASGATQMYADTSSAREQYYADPCNFYERMG